MEIVKTIEESKAITAGKKNVLFNVQKKLNVIELHEGHRKAAIESRQFGDTLMIGFWYLTAITAYVNDKFVLEDLTWDKEGCIEWARSLGADFCYAPDYKDEIAICSFPSFQERNEWSKRVWVEEGYDKFYAAEQHSEKARINCLCKSITNTGWTYVYSRKDGITRYINADFMKKYTKSTGVVVDPVKSPEGLFYSSSYFKYSDKEKQIVANIEPMILEFDFSKNTDILKNNLNYMGEEINLDIQWIKYNASDKLFGPGKALINCTFSVGKDDNIKYDHYAFLKEF